MKKAQELARRAPIGAELRGRDFCDEDWNRSNGHRFIRCLGVQDYFSGSERQYEEDAPLEEFPQATYMITATDRKWFAHLRVGMEWETTAYDCDKRSVVPPSWLTPAVTAIAQDISEQGTADHLPILADALEDAGCKDEHVLHHCRDPGRHARVCWLIDLLLGIGKCRDR